jgi:transposase
MDHFAGLDVSVNETSVCIVDDTGRIVREVKVASEPDALLPVLTNPAYRFKRIGLEAGPLSQWLFSALAEAELPVIWVETRQAVLKAQINKTDRNDARGIAQMMRVGLYRPVHCPLGPIVSLTARPPERLFHLVFESHDGRALVPIPKRSTSPRATSTLRWWRV